MSSNVRQMQPRSTAPHRDLEGKVALITGASSGIGKAIAIEMGRRGARVVVNYIGNPDNANDVVNTINGADGEAVAIEADVSKSADVSRMIAHAISEMGTIEVLVNNAGIEKVTPFLEKPEEEWDRIVSVDLKGVFLCTQAAAREMAKRGRGTIIN